MYPDLAFEQRFVEADGTRLEVFVGAASGPFICTTHPFVPPGGNTVSTLVGSPYIRALASAGRLVVVNPRGTGSSPAAEQVDDLTMRRLADDLETVRRGLRLDQWIVAGGSSGANVALLYALAYPSALRGLMLFTTGPVGAAVLENPDALGSPRHPRHAGLDVSAPLFTEPSALGRDGSEWRQLRPDLWCCSEDGVPRLMLPRRTDAPLSARHRAALEEFAVFDISADFGAIRVPTLVVCARRDELIPLCECERLAGIPGAQLVVLEESGHSLDEIDRFAETVGRFVWKLGVAGHVQST
jgi:pimeloyl-ACP methyl ester carboxylesterase